MTVAEIVQAIEPYPSRLALVTGGEPMLQESVHDLFRALLDRNYTVCLETGGHMPLEDVDPRVHRIVDLKCPSSLMSERNRYENIACLTANDEIKFVVGDRRDFDWACNTIGKFDLTARVGEVLISPVHGALPYAELASWILDSGLPVKMQLQLHRIIWPEIARGV
jgi:7-carboxy-7-deazaguanine synthase